MRYPKSGMHTSRAHDGMRVAACLAWTHDGVHSSIHDRLCAWQAPECVYRGDSKQKPHNKTRDGHLKIKGGTKRSGRGGNCEWRHRDLTRGVFIVGMQLAGELCNPVGRIENNPWKGVSSDIRFWYTWQQLVKRVKLEY